MPVEWDANYLDFFYEYRIQVVANDGEFSVGMAVRVKESVKVYHLPNSGAEGVDMKDREGVIVSDATKQEVHANIFCRSTWLLSKSF